MKITSYAVARPAYYDRTAVAATGAYYNTVGPHATTVRITYTTPAGKKALLEVATLELIRSVAATVAGNLDLQMLINSGGTDVRAGHVATNTNTVGTLFQDKLYGAPTIYAGETCSGTSSDGSTGGTVTYAITNKITQFDA